MTNNLVCPNLLLAMLAVQVLDAIGVGTPAVAGVGVGECSCHFVSIQVCIASIALADRQSCPTQPRDAVPVCCMLWLPCFPAGEAMMCSPSPKVEQWCQPA
jgi:hypothetical protein